MGKAEKITPKRPPTGKAPFDEPLTAAEKRLTPEQLRQKHVLEAFEERQSAASGAAKDVPSAGGKSEPLNDPLSTDTLEPRTRKQAGVSLEEDHHIATRYRNKNKAIFKRAGSHIDDDLNLIKEFPEHGQLRGSYDWKNPGYKFDMRGHHPDYNNWVSDTLANAIPPTLPRNQARARILRINQQLETIIRQHPEVLSHGPDILPPHLRNLTF